MIGNTTEYNDLILEWLEYKFGGDPDEYGTPEQILEHIKSFNWSAGCPGMRENFRARLPEEALMDTGNGEKLWISDCPEFSEESKNFIYDTLDASEITEDFSSFDLNDGGCRECWLHHYLFGLAIVKSLECFWNINIDGESEVNERRVASV